MTRKIHTSYYGNIKNIPKDYLLVATSGYIPPEIEKLVDIWDKTLAPSKSIYFNYKSDSDESEYVNRFKLERLSKINICGTMQKWHLHALEYGKENKDIILLCYERPEEFCHRHILAEAFEKVLNCKILEYGSNGERKDFKIIGNTEIDILF